MQFTVDEAARLLRMERPQLRRLLQSTEVSSEWPRSGQIGDQTLRLLYRKLNGRQ